MRSFVRSFVVLRGRATLWLSAFHSSSADNTDNNRRALYIEPKHILFGVFGKLGAAFNSIPICVVGGLVLQCFASVFVSGMIIATKHVTRRNSFIIMISLAHGVGVALEPNLFEGGGVASFYGQNLRNNIGFWPRYKTCKDYPEVTVVTAPATCEVNGYTWCGPSVASSSTPSMRPAPLAGRRTPTTSTRRVPLCRASSRRP